MKNHKQKDIHISMYDLEGPLVPTISMLKGYGAEVIDPVIVLESWYGDTSIVIRGWVPMDAKEIAAAKKRSAAAKVARAARTKKDKAKELKDFHKQAEKLGMTVVDLQPVKEDPDELELRWKQVEKLSGDELHDPHGWRVE